MDLEQIEKIMAKLEASKLKRLVIKKGDFELQLEKEGEVPVHIAPHPRVVVESAPESAFQNERGSAGRKVEVDGKYVASPMVGTFYATPSPDSPPFVKVGDRVSENTIVCIVEAMKVMNEVKAGIAGTIAEVLADTGQPVEFGTKLFRIT